MDNTNTATKNDTSNINNTKTSNNYTNSIPPNYNVNGNINTNIYEDTNTYEGLFFSIFNKSNITMFLWFLAIYFIAYFVLGFLFNKNEDVSNYQLRFSRTIDIISLLCLLIIIISTYANYSSDRKQSIVQNMANDTITFIDTPVSIFSTFLFIFCFYIVVYLFRLPMDRETKPVILSLIESGAWILFIVILFVDFFKYVLNISLTDLLTDFLNWNNLPDYYSYPSVGNLKSSGNVKTNGNVNLQSLSYPVQKDEVFNISNNLYTYDDAQAICTAYSSKLATYDQMEDAYKNGAEWCNYGWSEGQMAFFPTQKSTWQNLQQTDNKNACGRPGINGGYFANPYIKFGVNCYGKKPVATDAELARMHAQNAVVQPKKPSDTILDKKVKFWKDNADKLLVLNSFNKKEWSEY
jgi:hypothetical protein